MTRHIANALLAEALEAHGSLSRWRDLEGISSTILLGGALWRLKGIDLPPIPRVVTTDFHRQWARFTPFVERKHAMMWTPDHLAVEDGMGLSIAERSDPGQAFIGHSLTTPWDILHLAYFNGCAMWTYHALPFVLADSRYEISEIAPIAHEGGTLRGVSARFPDGTHSHCRDQQFYFDAEGLLVRHDYTIDVLGGVPATHFLFDYVDVDGLRLPTRRSEYLRNDDGSPNFDINTVTIAMSRYLLR